MAINYSINELKEIAEILSQKTGLPYLEMTHSFFKRRLSFVYDKFSIRKTNQFIDQLADVNFRDAVNADFAIKTTELFRDPGFWRKLRSIMREKNTAGEPFYVWIPGVTSGEELYSLLILAEENGLRDALTIATSYSSSCAAENVKKGIFSQYKSDINQYNYKRFEGTQSLDKYFEHNEAGTFLKKDLLSNVNFEIGLFPTEKAGQKVSLVIFRNKMLYYTKAFHSVLFEQINNNLKPGGIVCLGIKESLPDTYNQRFECLDAKEGIYRKYVFLSE